MRRTLLALAASALLLGVAAPSAAAAGERSFRGSCHQGKLRASVILRTHLLYSRKTRRSYRTIYRVVYRLRGMDSRKRRSLVFLHANTFTDRETGKLAPTPLNGYPVGIAQYVDSIVSDGRGHTLDSRKWQGPLFWGTYRSPLASYLDVNYGYLLNFAFGDDLGEPSCPIRLPNHFP